MLSPTLRNSCEDPLPLLRPGKVNKRYRGASSPLGRFRARDPVAFAPPVCNSTAPLMKMSDGRPGGGSCFRAQRVIVREGVPLLPVLGNLVWDACVVREALSIKFLCLTLWLRAKVVVGAQNSNGRHLLQFALRIVSVLAASFGCLLSFPRYLYDFATPHSDIVCCILFFFLPSVLSNSAQALLHKPHFQHPDFFVLSSHQGISFPQALSTLTSLELSSFQELSNRLNFVVPSETISVVPVVV